MTKRPPDQTSPQSGPPLKHSRQEHHSHPLPSERLQELIQILRICIRPDDEIIPERIYDQVRAIYRGEGALPEKFVDEDVFKTNFRQEGPQFSQVLRRAMATDASEDDQRAVPTHSVFWTVPSSRSLLQPTEQIIVPESQKKAVEDSWTAGFIGQDSLKALGIHVRQQMLLEGRYARYCSIVQSSGMGKSRLLDEFAKRHFLIPINLRLREHRGFPPADHDVRDFLTSIDSNNPEMDKISFSRARHFLKALFVITKRTIIEELGDGDGACERENRILQFRTHMSDEQSMDTSGNKRKNFYKNVINMAKTGMVGGDLTNEALRAAFEDLRKELNGGRSSKNHSSRKDPVLPDVFIAFDEAQPLTVPFSKGSTQNNFVELRRALRVLSAAQLFTFFLSTTGKVSLFTPPRGYDASNRMNDGELKMPRPFIYLGFDQLMESRKVFDKYRTLEDVTSLDCIAHMGRPLWGTCYDFGDDQVRDGLLHFAIQKLLGEAPGDSPKEAQEFAVLSQRLALDINSTQYTVPDNPLAVVEKIGVQISNHMRVCVAIGEGIETIRGIAASEPILSEAASRVMRGGYGFNLPDALTEVLGGFGISPGDRAELLVSAFFTWARDKTVLGKPLLIGQLSCYFSVRQLFSCLFSASIFTSMSRDVPSLCPPGATRQTFGQVFDNALMHFNHFVKPQEQKLLTRGHLLTFMARGAAALGANCQPGIDAVYPYLYGSTYLDVKNVGFIVVQVKKNDVTEQSQAEIFQKMDPFGCGLLLESDQVDGKFPIPIIRIVFALCNSKAPAVTHKTYSSPSEGASSVDNDGQPRFTSYDFWCSGIGPSILQPVEEAPERWAALVDKSDPWRTFYNDAPVPDLLRSQFPASGSNRAHFDSWSAYFPESD